MMHINNADIGDKNSQSDPGVSPAVTGVAQGPTLKVNAEKRKVYRYRYR